MKSRKIESIALLAGGIAHDFNNILTGLFGNIELAKLKLSPDHESYKHIETAYKALDNASSLTKQLLTFAKGGDPLLEIINIKQVVLDSIKFTLSGSNIKTSLNLSDDLWLVKADKSQISQVITNLAINAVHAMPEGGTLLIEAKNIKANDIELTPNLAGEFIKLIISDNGPGIPKAHLEQIFDPYFTTKQTGNGLGLTTVHSIIVKHNGNIYVDSELGRGNTFTVFLPAETSLPESVETISLSIPKESESRKAHVLVMDDNEIILDLAKDMLESFGCSVDTSVDGKDAITKYITADKSSKSFDLVIMDLTIPDGMGGKEAVKKLMAIDPKAKVIVSNGYSTDPIMAN